MKGEKGLQIKLHRHLEKYSKMNKREFELYPCTAKTREVLYWFMGNPSHMVKIFPQRKDEGCTTYSVRCTMYNPVQKISMPKGTAGEYCRGIGCIQLESSVNLAKFWTCTA